MEKGAIVRHKKTGKFRFVVDHNHVFGHKEGVYYGSMLVTSWKIYEKVCEEPSDLNSLLDYQTIQIWRDAAKSITLDKS